MTETMADRPMPAAGQFLRRAAGWWLAELAGMAPALLRSLSGRVPRDAAVLDLNGDDAILLPQGRGRLASPSSSRRAGSTGSVTVRIDPAHLFVTSLDLPQAAKSSLEAVLRHQIERLVPLPSSATCYAHRVLPAAAGAKTFTVVVAVAKRATVEQALEQARGLDLAPRRIIAEVEAAGAAPLVLWHADAGRGGTVGRRRLYRGLEIAALALALLAYGLHIQRLDQVRDGLRQAVAQARQDAAATREMGRLVARSSEALAFLRARRQEATPLMVLDELSRLLPLDSWVSELMMRGREVEIVGVSPHASELIGLIQGSAAFGHARFRSPIMLLPDGRAERFDVTFDVKAGDLKARP